MDKKRIVSWIITVVIVFVLGGFVWGLSYNDLNFCTTSECSCDGSSLQVDCNQCSVYNPVFIGIVANLGKTCRASEIMTCSNNEKEIKVDYNRCRYIWNSYFNKIGYQTGAIILDNSSNEN